jgi:AraC-like DNA-binding protein
MEDVTKVYIKGMVCHRCIQVIREELMRLGVDFIQVGLGEIALPYSLPLSDLKKIEDVIYPLGFQLLEDRKIAIVKRLKELVAVVYGGNYDFPLHFRFSNLIVQQIGKDYNTISAWFTLLEQKTLERYIISYRIEKVKEYLVYSKLTLADIAFKLNFSNVSHLSRQFKQHTGLTPSHFKEIKKAKETLAIENAA